MDSLEIIKGIVLIFALTMDSFVVSFAYGVSRIRMGTAIVIGMNLVMSGLLGAAIFTGNRLASLLPEGVTQIVGFLLLFAIGSYRLYSYFHNRSTKENDTEVKELSMLGGLGLAFVLSLDSLAVGIGTGLVESGQMLLVLGSFAAGIAMMKAGWFLGNGSRQVFNRDLSWLSGVCLLLLAVGTLR